MSEGPDFGGSDGITIRQVAKRIREPRRRVRYHLDALCDQGLIEVAGERNRRGVVERCYRSAVHPVLTKNQVEALSADRQKKIVLEILKAIFSDATAALEARDDSPRRPESATIHD